MHAAALIHQRPQFITRESAQDGKHAVVAADGMKEEGKRDRPDSGRGQPAPPQVAHDDAMARHALHLAQEGGERVAGKVVRHLVAGHHIHAAIGEREEERRAADDVLCIGARAGHETGIDIERD